MATLIVGADKVQVTCHKALLAYFSEYFNVALYGAFSEASTNEVVLDDEDSPELRPELVKVFVNWVYTGKIIWQNKDITAGKYEECEKDWSLPAPALELWVLGDRLLAYKFTNLVMTSFLTFLETTPGREANTRMPASTVEFVYGSGKTTEGSKLRRLIKDMIREKGPFGRYGYEPGTKQRDDWVELCARGGDIVRDHIEHGFHKDGALDQRPYHPQNRGKYLFDIEGKSVAEWAKACLGISI